MEKDKCEKKELIEYKITTDGILYKVFIKDSNNEWIPLYKKFTIPNSGIRAVDKIYFSKEEAINALYKFYYIKYGRPVWQDCMKGVIFK